MMFILSFNSILCAQTNDSTSKKKNKFNYIASVGAQAGWLPDRIHAMAEFFQDNPMKKNTISVALMLRYTNPFCQNNLSACSSSSLYSYNTAHSSRIAVSALVGFLGTTKYTYWSTYLGFNLNKEGLGLDALIQAALYDKFGVGIYLTFNIESADRDEINQEYYYGSGLFFPFGKKLPQFSPPKTEKRKLPPKAIKKKKQTLAVISAGFGAGVPGLQVRFQGESNISKKNHTFHPAVAILIRGCESGFMDLDGTSPPNDMFSISTMIGLIHQSFLSHSSLYVGPGLFDHESKGGGVGVQASFKTMLYYHFGLGVYADAAISTVGPLLGVGITTGFGTRKQ